MVRVSIVVLVALARTVAACTAGQAVPPTTHHVAHDGSFVAVSGD